MRHGSARDAALRELSARTDLPPRIEKIVRRKPVDAAEWLVEHGDMLMTSPMNTVSPPPSTKWVVRLRSNSHNTRTFRTAPVRTTDQMIGGMLVPPAWMRARRRS